MTDAEKLMWQKLRGRRFLNLKFRRQHLIEGYIVDFICIEKMLIIELDGGQHNEPESVEYDHRRTKVLTGLGYRVLRFWNNQVCENLDGVLEIVKRELSV